MANVFANPYNGTLVWSAQAATITFYRNATETSIDLLTGTTTQSSTAARTDLNLAVTNIQVQFTRQSRTFYPLNQEKAIRMVGAPSGTIQIQGMVGPSTTMANFLDMFGDPCATFAIKILAPNNTRTGATSSSCLSAKTQVLYCDGCTGEQIGFTMQDQGNGMAICQIPVVITFTEMDWNNSGASSEDSSEDSYEDE